MNTTFSGGTVDNDMGLVMFYIDDPGIAKLRFSSNSYTPYVDGVKGGTTYLRGVSLIDATKTVVITVNVAKNNQAALSINSDTTHVFGTNYEISTEGGSGTGAVSYQIVSVGGSEWGAGSISGNILTITRPGQIKLRAAKAGDDSYYDTTSNDFILNVTLPANYIKLDDISQDTSVHCDSGGDVSGKIFLAAYDAGGKLIKVSDIKSITPGIRQAYQFTNFEQGLIAGCKVKAFAWSDIETTIKPLSTSIDTIWQ